MDEIRQQRMDVHTDGARNAPTLAIVIGAAIALVLILVVLEPPLFMTMMMTMIMGMGGMTGTTGTGGMMVPGGIGGTMGMSRAPQPCRAITAERPIQMIQEEKWG